MGGGIRSNNRISDAEVPLESCLATCSGFLSAFLPKGGGEQVWIRVQSMWQTRGVGEILILDLLLDAIW